MVIRIRKVLFLFLLLQLLVVPVSTTFAAPYEGYNFSFWGLTKPAPLPYLPARQIDGKQLNIGAFKGPEDFTVTNDNHIYVADTGNNRIVAMDSDWKVERIITTFKNGSKDDTFAQPNGIFVNDRQEMYVADTGNKRIVVLTTGGQFIRVVADPTPDVPRQGFVYMPIKVAVDSADRMYVISKGGFDGILQFNKGGRFMSFIGLSAVRFNPVDLFWKRISTKAQRTQMVMNIPSEFSNLDLDPEGFIYATSAEEFGTPFRRINASSVDVLRRQGYHPIVGDIHPGFNGDRRGPSTFISVAYDQNGIFDGLDRKRGRIFTYDRDGNLLYEFGHLGEQMGNFKTPVEVDTMGDQVIVLDKGFNQLTVFTPTSYGKVIRDAAIYTDEGDEKKATAAWDQVRKYNNNLELAYMGIGKTELRAGNYAAAMANFKGGMRQGNYSAAFELYRKEYMWRHFTTIAVCLLGAIAAIIVASRLKARYANLDAEPGPLANAWTSIFHPFRGFWDAKYEQKGRVWLALLMLLLLSIFTVAKWELSGFIFNWGVVFERTSVIDAFKFTMVPFFLWCAANWSLTTLMDGEGKFKEIVMVTGYALIPKVLVQIPLILLSNVLTANEASFYGMIDKLTTVWFLWLLFVGIQTVHQYTIKKTVLTMGLTVVVILIILFIGLLFFSLLNEVVSFGQTVYKEITFRIGEG